MYGFTGEVHLSEYYAGAMVGLLSKSSDTKESGQIGIIIGEPLGIVRSGLHALLEREEALAVLGEAGIGAELVRLVARLRPDVLLLDPGLPGIPADQLLSETMALHPALKVLLLASPSDIPASIALLDAGAAGCILKSDRPDDLVRAIHAVAGGEPAISSGVAIVLLKRQSEQPALVEPLTEREHEVYDLLAAGLSNKEIAQKLYLSVRTVEVHLRNIFAKLGVRSRLEAVTRGTSGDPSGSSGRTR